MALNPGVFWKKECAIIASSALQVPTGHDFPSAEAFSEQTLYILCVGTPL